MKLTIPQPSLALGLSQVARAVSTRSTLPVLANVLIRATNGHVELAATNLEIAVIAEIYGKIEEQGAVTVSARTINDLVKALPDGLVSLHLNGENIALQIEAGATEASVKGIDAEEFPLLMEPDEDDPRITFPAAAFRQAVNEVVFAAAAGDNTRPALAGMFLSVHDHVVELAATDGFRLSTRTFVTDTGSAYKPIKLIIPARALVEVLRLMPADLPDVELVLPRKRSGQAVFLLGPVTLYAQLTDGNYPDYRAVIPKEWKTQATVDADRLLRAAKLANVFARDASKTALLSIGDGKINVSAQAQETGSNEMELEATVDGPELEVRLNIQYLIDALSIVRAPAVVISGNSGAEPVVIRSTEDGNDWLHLIMPMQMER